ncbi:MAG: gamma carbonic anhydrase family protein [Omnitrophica WOR_2 bacterium RIFCSPHIGHO2_01_FULL_49_10]|nr:MAG: gamma carbonic anhydrase family protein [Omnitrophica WOR_2 bacterium RIFCSPHIGHO2_01_FULL_49_10]OGX35555.1 MAG: gamma carbonic anhydrase family protein [Omnitrophica WOR_2 bacterium RIFCSPLOWO2_02_FULL_50_19]
MIAKFLNRKPKIAKTAFVAPDAQLIGSVEIGGHSSIWFNVVARADINKIKIGSYTNIQDGSVLHVDDELGVHIGDHVTVGHNAIIHACRIGDHALVGMGAIILNGAEIGKGSIVAAGGVVRENSKIEDYTLVAGVPARVIRKLSEEEKKENIYWAKKYSSLAEEYKRKG